MRPIFTATHPRACSTAFERVFMTRRDILRCVHEPFGDAFYFGPERLSKRFDQDEEARRKSGFENTTYKDVFDQIDLEGAQKDGKRIFIKDIAHYLIPPSKSDLAPRPVPSLLDVHSKGSAKPGTEVDGDGSPVQMVDGGIGVNGTTSHAKNPTVVPVEFLRSFHFTFLIRHPQRAIPSYYRCTVPPLDEVTGFRTFDPSEAGYDELRRLFDYLKDESIIGTSEVPITVVDADDLLDQPEDVIREYCRHVNIEFSPQMLQWESEEDHEHAVTAFEKWRGFHDDAINSKNLRPRIHDKKPMTEAREDAEWREKFGEEGQKVIRDCIDANIPDYEYLKSFAIRV